MKDLPIEENKEPYKFRHHNSQRSILFDSHLAKSITSAGKLLIAQNYDYKV